MKSILVVVLALFAIAAFADEPLSLADVSDNVQSSTAALDAAIASAVAANKAEEASLDSTVTQVKTSLSAAATATLIGSPTVFRESLDLNYEYGVSSKDAKSPTVHKDGQICTLNGAIAVKPMKFDEPLAYLQASCWPAERRQFLAAASGDRKTRIDILANGHLVCVTGCPTGGDSWISLSGIVYSVNKDAAPIKLSTAYQNYERKYATATVDKSNGRCFLAGTLKLRNAGAKPGDGNAADSDKTFIGVVHAGCLPRNDLTFNTNHGDRATRIEIKADGKIFVKDHTGGANAIDAERRWTWVSLNGISYHTKYMKGDIHEGLAYTNIKLLQVNKDQVINAGAEPVWSLHGDNCQLSGTIQAAKPDLQIPSALFTLNPRCRPTRKQTFLVANGSSNNKKVDSKFATATVDEEGRVEVQLDKETKWVSLDSITFSVHRGYGATARRMPLFELMPLRNKPYILALVGDGVFQLTGTAQPPVVSGTWMYKNALDCTAKGTILSIPDTVPELPKTGYTFNAWFKIGPGFFNGRHVLLQSGSYTLAEVENGELVIRTDRVTALKKKNNMFPMREMKQGWHMLSVRVDEAINGVGAITTYVDGVLYNQYQHNWKTLPTKITSICNDETRSDSFGVAVAGIRFYDEVLSPVRIGQFFTSESSDYKADFVNSMNRVYARPGLPGPSGRDGRDGKNGAPGSQGERGIQGPPGLVGAQGTTGAVVVGPEGPRGPRGFKGEAGKDGRDGRDGKNGYIGKDGRNGVDGKDGKDGENGKPGIDGTDGKNGVDGKNGHDGRDGAMGPTGPRGPEGPKGDDGQVGPAGPTGLPGAPGRRGPVGPSAQ